MCIQHSNKFYQSREDQGHKRFQQISNVSREYQLIDWRNVKVMNRESDRTDTVIREAIEIRKTNKINQDDGSYQPTEPRLRHVTY